MHTVVVMPVCMHFLNICDIILVGEDNVMLLS